MSPRIGVYDSGVGGLSTLALLQAKLPGCGWLYFADNARMPFGSKSRAEVLEAAANALNTLRKNADEIVFGCNTAGVTLDPDGVFALRPDIDSHPAQSTLVLATPRTLAGLNARERGFMCADTAELAVLVEIQLSLRFKSRTSLTCAPLADYLDDRLSRYRDRAKTVLLGCSHYIYAEREIRGIIGDAEYLDGNAPLAEKLCAALYEKYGTSPFLPACDAETKFIFTGGDESAKYRWILAKLREEYVPRFLKNGV